MYTRLLHARDSESFFLFGPRGTGKSSWVRATFPKAVYLDLLDDDLHRSLVARPETLVDYLPARTKTVIIDEVQRVPALLNEVHRLIENQKLQFVLTGSSARKLRRQGVNLLAGRALTQSLFPLTAHELKADFDLRRSLRTGCLPLALKAKEPRKFLSAYVNTYLKEEVAQEGLTRQIGSFARFLETASFSQAGLLSISEIARDAQVNRKVAEDYFVILRDLLLSYELPVFTKRAKRELMTRRKFYFFDAGLYRALRPQGPLDSEQELNGAAFETLCFQELYALNHYFDRGYSFYHWRTRKHQEVDLVLYGERGLLAFEFKSGRQVRDADLAGLKLFGADYPEAKLPFVHGGPNSRVQADIRLISADDFFRGCAKILS